jgi:hypothetical protein
MGARTVFKASSPVQADWCLLRFQSRFSDPERQVLSSALTFNPSLFEQVLQYYVSIGQLERFDPTPTSEPLHKLPFALGGDRHRIFVYAARLFLREAFGFCTLTRSSLLSDALKISRCAASQ